MLEQFVSIVLAVTMVGIMTSLGMSLRPSDFRAVLNRPGLLAASLITFSIVLPLVGFFLGLFFTDSVATAVGLMVLSACPGGMLSNALTSYAKGDVALSISLTSVVSLVTIMTLPIVSYVAARTFLDESVIVEVPILETTFRILCLTTFPVVFGMYMNIARSTVARRVRGPLKHISSVLLVSIFAIYSIIGGDQFDGDVTNAFVLVGILNVVSIAIGTGVALALQLPVGSGVAYVLEHSVKQEGLGLYIATAVIAVPAAAIPLLVNSLIGLVLGVTIVVASRVWLSNTSARNVKGDKSEVIVTDRQTSL